MRKLLGIVLLFVAACSRSVGQEPIREPLSWGGPGRGPGLFVTPRAVAASAAGLFIVDMSGRIQLFDFEGSFKRAWELPKINRGFPAGLGIAPDGNLAVADTHNYVVRLYTPEGKEIKAIGKDGGGPGEFTYVTDVAFDVEGFMYVSEHGRQDRIQKFSPNGVYAGQWGRAGDAPGEFHRPQALAIGKDGSVYVADACNHRIQKFTRDGKLLSVLGSPGRGAGELLYPYDITITPGGHLVVCEYGNNRVQVFDQFGRSVEILGKAGREPGELAAPRGAAFVPGQGIYVVDTENQRIQLFEPRKGWARKEMAP